MGARDLDSIGEVGGTAVTRAACAWSILSASAACCVLCLQSSWSVSL